MSINYRQSQFELFPGNTGSVNVTQQKLFEFSPLVLSLENIIVLCIILVMALVVCFASGIEQGRRMASLEQKVRIPKPSLAVSPAVNANTISPPIQQLPSRGKVPSSVKVKTNVLPVSTKALNAPVVMAKAPVAVVGIVNKPFTVQVASYKQLEYARKEAVLLKQRGIEVNIVTKGRHSIVCAGRFATMNEAQQFSNQLRRIYKDCMVRRI